MGSMSAMTNTTPALHELPEFEQATLRYYAREARGIDNTGAPLGGLTVERFKFARARLVQRGLLCRDHRGRYRPSAMHDDIW
jgi:hypothetical protein